MQARSPSGAKRRTVLSLVAALPVAIAMLGAVSACAAGGPYDSVDFFRAIEVDNAGRLSDMIVKGFDPNTRNDKDQPALSVALLGQSPKAAKVLWEAPGIQIDALNKAGETPLMMAALKGESDACAALLAHGASLKKDGWTPLHYAATGGNAGIVRMFLAKGAPIEARSPNNSTPLMMAAKYGSEDAVDALLAAGADRSAKNDLGMNASAFAASGGREKLAARLKPAAN